MNRSAIRPFAARVLRHAEWLLPEGQAEWARAMRSELQQIDDDHEALAWALGCLLASIKMRSSAMVLGNFRVSRWVLALEMALCFVPLTLGWIDVVFGQSGIVRLNSDIVERYFLAVPGGTTMLILISATAILGLLGPVGVLLALRAIVLNQPVRSARIAGAVIAGSVLLGVVLLAQHSAAGAVDIAGMLIMFSLLPAAGMAHLTHLGGALNDRPLAA